MSLPCVQVGHAVPHPDQLGEHGIYADYAFRSAHDCSYPSSYSSSYSSSYPSAYGQAAYAEYCVPHPDKLGEHGLYAGYVSAPAASAYPAAPGYPAQAYPGQPGEGTAAWGYVSSADAYRAPSSCGYDSAAYAAPAQGVSPKPASLQCLQCLLSLVRCQAAPCLTSC